MSNKFPEPGPYPTQSIGPLDIPVGELTLDEFQDIIDNIKRKPVPGAMQIDRMVFCALEVAGEGGEVADQMKKALRDDDQVITMERREKVLDELGDTLFAVALMARQMSVSLEEIGRREIDKIEQRGSTQ